MRTMGRMNVNAAKTPSHIATTIEISSDLLESTLDSAIHHDPNNWMTDHDVVRPAVVGKSLTLIEHFMQGGAIKFITDDGEHVLDGADGAAKIGNALRTLFDKYPHHFAAIVGDNADAETGDALLQVLVFGEIEHL